MEFKDNRSKEKRIKTKQHRKGLPLAMPQRVNHSRNEPSASYKFEDVRGVIDVADSSDERFTVRPTARFISPMPRRDLDELDLNDKQIEEHPQLNAGDFKIMSQMPASVGGHFQFSSEKNWDTDEPLLFNTQASEYFTMNLKLLNVGLQSIPFYKRMDYASSMFNREQLIAMDEAAEAVEKQYQDVLREHENNPKIHINSGKRAGSAKSQASSKVESKKEQDDELDELLSMTEGKSIAKMSLQEEENKALVKEAVTVPAGSEERSSTAVEGGKTAPENKEDIQQWLDNVLDE